MVLPHGANGWQLCMAAYGITFGARLLCPALFGAGEAFHLISAFGMRSELIGLVILVHAAASALSVFVLSGASYSCPALSSIGAMLWTAIGISHAALEIGAGT